ncbi:MAG: outer membrane beta-barrel protein [Desulfobaccales bacterium]
MKKLLCLAVAILGFFTFCLIPDPGSRAWGNQLGSELEITLVPAASMALLGLGGYMVWKDRLSQPPDAVGREGYHGPGEYYFGGFMGVSLVGNNNWSWEPIEFPYGSPATPTNLHELQTAEKNVKTDPGLVGGVKAGYFLDSIPYLGFDGEGSIASNYRPRQVVTVKPAISGFPVVAQEQGNMIWDMAFHIVGRYGFLPDKDVPFGRLQPYIGIGPDVCVLYFQNDSAKNFGLDGEAGLRYMITKYIGAFVEFNYIKQWDVELGVQHLTSGGQRFISAALPGTPGKTVHFDFDNQKIVAGLEYHF